MNSICMKFLSLQISSTVSAFGKYIAFITVLQVEAKCEKFWNKKDEWGAIVCLPFIFMVVP